MFKKGQMAVYPAHGVGIIENIEKKEISGKLHKFYVMRVLGNDMTIMIPVNNANQVGLREVIPGKDVAKVYKILKAKETSVETQTWNRRYREYMERIKTGSVYEVATVLRDLFLLKLGKELSFGERRMMDIAKNLLIKELSIAQEKSEDHIEKHIEQIFEA